MSHSQSTEQAYLARSRRLYERAKQAALGSGASAPYPTAMVHWLIALKPTWKAATWRQNKAAMLWLLRHLAADQALPLEFRQNAAEANARLEAEQQTGTLRRSTRTSAGKSRRMPDSAVGPLLAFLDARRGQWRWAGLTAGWLRAGLLTGLRPSEWRDAHLETDSDGAIWLVVSNGKIGNGRANGPTRRLQLAPDRLSPAELEVIESHLTGLSTLNASCSFRQLQECARQCLRHAQRLLTPARTTGQGKRPTLCLYGARHQFAADAKASGFSKCEVAALLGHASDQTAGQHYARRTSGRSGLRVSPAADNVNSVRAIRKAGPGASRKYRAAP